MTTVQQAIAACDVVQAYLREQTGQSPQPTPTPTPEPTPQPPVGNASVVALDWQNPQRVFSNAPVIALEFTTGSTDTHGRTVRISGAEYNDGPSDMTAVISETAGDFDHPIGPQIGPSKSMTAQFYVGSPGTYYPTLQPNTRYYVNVKNDEGRNKFFDLSRGNFA